MTKSRAKNTSSPSTSTPGLADPLGPKHAKLLAFLATRGQVEFDAGQVKKARQLIKAARAELLGPLPATTTATILDGWVRRITLTCTEARRLWPELATSPPALARLEEIEVVFDDQLDAWIDVAARHPLRFTRFYLNAEYVDQSTGECLDLSDGSARMVAAVAALPYATDLVLELYLGDEASFATFDLPELETLVVRTLSDSDSDFDARVLATLNQARLPKLRRLAWESFAALEPSAAVAAVPQATELGFWGLSHAAVLQALVEQRPSLTALGMSAADEPDDDTLQRLAEGRRLFPPRGHYIPSFNAGYRLRYRLERHADAEPHFALLRARTPDDADTHFQYGNAVDDDHAKVNAYCEALVVDPDHGPAHANLGNALIRLGRQRLGIQHFRRYLADHPEFAEGWRTVARAHRELGEEAEALAAEANIPPE